MTTIERTPFDRLEQEGRLFNAVLKAPTKDGYFGFRGDIALKFQARVADEKRPPDFSIEQVLTHAQEGGQTIPILVGYLHSFAYLEAVAEVLSDLLSPSGTYLIFCNNVDLRAKYRLKINDITYHILPCDESTVWKEMLDLFGFDKNDVKKLDTAGKTEFVLSAAAGFDGDHELITFEKGVELMGPVRNRNENRPV